MKRIAVLLAVSMAVGSCSQGVVAPPVDPTNEFCTETFCLEAPDGWDGEVGASFVALHHEVDEGNTFLTGSMVDMEAVVEASGGTWPVTTDEVVRAWWALLEQADVGSLDRTQRMVGGSVRSWGSHETGDMWFVLVPIDSAAAIGVEIRGPNDSWESHADVVFPSVRPR